MRECEDEGTDDERCKKERKKESKNETEIIYTQNCDTYIGAKIGTGVYWYEWGRRGGAPRWAPSADLPPPASAQIRESNSE